MPVLELANPLYAMVIMSQILLGGSQSNLANLNNLCHNPKVNGQRKTLLNIQTSGLRTL